MKLYSRASRHFLIPLFAFFLCHCQGLSAQESLEAILQRLPSAPPGVPVPPVPGKPVYYKMAEGQDIKVTFLARGLNHPYGLASLADGSFLISERDKGRLRVIHNGVLDPRNAATVSLDWRCGWEAALIEELILQDNRLISNNKSGC